MDEDIAQKFYRESKAASEIKKEICPYSLWAFISATFPLWGLAFFFIPVINIIYFVLVIPLLVTSIVFAIISFGKIKQNESIMWGRGFSIASIIISLLEITIMFIVLAFFYGVIFL